MSLLWILVGLEICFLSQACEVLALGRGPTRLCGRCCRFCGWLTVSVPGSLWPWRVWGVGVSRVSGNCQFEQRPVKANLGVTLLGFLRASRSDFNLTGRTCVSVCLRRRIVAASVVTDVGSRLQVQ